MRSATMKPRRPPGRPSRTAEIVAVSRARHLLRHRPPHVFNDPFAQVFLGGVWRTILGSRILDLIFSRVVLRRLMPITTQHLVRARFSESMLERAIEAGVRQYVILGAGFDTFALRRPDPAIQVFEVELAATIERKRARLHGAGINTDRAQWVFVPFDFERDDLGSALTNSGYDRTKPAFFSWMGVTYYLTPPAIIDTVRRLAVVAAPGSELVFDYLVSECCVLERDRQLFESMMRFVSRRGEPMIARFDPALAPHTFNPDGSWRIVGHESPERQSELYLGQRRDLPPLAPITWFLHLRRVP